MAEGIVQVSSHPGRYQVGVGGPDLTVGVVCAVWLGGHWLRGVIRHSRTRADNGGMVIVERPAGVYDSYYLEVEGAQGIPAVCGLCTGMYVRIA